MELIQKKFSNKLTFTFKDDYFNFAIKNKSGTDDFDLNYADIPEKYSTLNEQNEWLRNVGLLWCLLGCYRVGSAIYNDYPLSGTGFWLILGAICLIWFACTKVKYTVFKTERGNVLVLKAGNSEQIIAEIKSRKKQQLLKWYGEINLENSIEKEKEKFYWLANNHIISQVEAEEKIAQLEFSHKDSAVSIKELN